jgi:hypothetical protein
MSETFLCKGKFHDVEVAEKSYRCFYCGNLFCHDCMEFHLNDIRLSNETGIKMIAVAMSFDMELSDEFSKWLCIAKRNIKVEDLKKIPGLLEEIKTSPEWVYRVFANFNQPIPDELNVCKVKQFINGII